MKKQQNSIQINHNLNNQNPKQSKYRYINFIIFISLGLVNAVPAQTFTTISVQVSQIYNIDKTLVNLASLLYSIIHPPVTFLANFILEKYGLRIGIVIGSILIIIGVMIKLLIEFSFTYYLIGCAFAAVGHVFILNSPMKLAINWFREDQVSSINTFCVLSLITSNPIGSFIPILFINGYNHKSQKYIMNLLLFQAILIAIIQILAIIFIRNKPKVPANLRSKLNRQRFIPSLKQLIKNKNYLKMFLTMTVMWGSLSCYFVNIQWQIKPYGFKAIDAAYIIVVSNICGIIGSMCMTIITRYINSLKKITVVLSIFGSLGIILSFSNLQIQNIYSLLAFSGFTGFFFFPFISYSVQLGSYIAFPVGQATATGFLFTGGQTFGFLLGLFFTYLYDGKNKSHSRIGLIITLILLIIGIVSVILVKFQKVLDIDLIKQSQSLNIHQNNECKQ